MSEIALPGLKADVPIGAMAAFGLLRICSESQEFGDVRLHWHREGSVHTAILTAAKTVSPEEVVSALVEYVRNMGPRPEFTWAEQIKSATRDQYRTAALPLLATATASSHAGLDWLSCFSSELSGDEEGILEQSPFDMTVARQKFLADALKLTDSLRPTKAKKGQPSPKLSFAEALFGPWRYQDDQHALGWDPSTVRLGAFTSRAPTEMTNSGVRAAVWLAMESLPLFPCFYSEGRQRTRCFYTERRMAEFRWPIWTSPLSLTAVNALLSLRTLTEDSVDLKELKARGVDAVYRSVRGKPNKYITSFQSAILCTEKVNQIGDASASVTLEGPEPLASGKSRQLKHLPRTHEQVGS